MICVDRIMNNKQLEAKMITKHLFNSWKLKSGKIWKKIRHILRTSTTGNNISPSKTNNTNDKHTINTIDSKTGNNTVNEKQSNGAVQWHMHKNQQMTQSSSDWQLGSASPGYKHQQHSRQMKWKHYMNIYICKWHYDDTHHIYEYILIKATTISNTHKQYTNKTLFRVTDWLTHLFNDTTDMHQNSRRNSNKIQQNTLDNKGQSNLTIGGFVANWGSGPQISTSCRGLVPQSNAVLLWTTWVSQPSGSFRTMTYIQTDRPRYGNMYRNESLQVMSTKSENMTKLRSRADTTFDMQ